MSYSARLNLLKVYLASIPIYLMSVIKFPKQALEAINSQMANFYEMTKKIIINTIFLICSLYAKRKSKEVWESLI
jgi:hypothetical protein